MVQGRCIVFIKSELQLYISFVAICIFVVDECKELKFGTLFTYSKFQSTDDKSCPNGCGHVT